MCGFGLDSCCYVTCEIELLCINFYMPTNFTTIDLWGRQHCHLTIWKWLVELTNSIRWQDPNNITDTGVRCLVYLEVLIRTAQCTEVIKQKVTVSGQSCTMPIACCTVEKRRPSCVWVRRSAERYVNWITRCLSVSPPTINFTLENWIFTWIYTL